MFELLTIKETIFLGMYLFVYFHVLMTRLEITSIKKQMKNK